METEQTETLDRDNRSSHDELAERRKTQSLAAAAFGVAAIDRHDFDLGKLILEAIVSAIDSLFGKIDEPMPSPNWGSKGAETRHAIVQHIVVPSVCQFVLGEMAWAGQGAHQKQILDAKARAELLISRALVVAALSNYEFYAAEEPREREAIPSSTAESDEDRAKRDEENRKKTEAFPGNFQATKTPDLTPFNLTQE